MEKLRKIINKNSTTNKVLILFVMTNLVYAFMLIVTIPKTMEFANGMKLLDMMPFGYNAEYIKTLFDALGEEGQQAYLFNQLPVDMIYPFLFGACYSLLIVYLLKKLKKSDSRYFYLAILPLIAGVADYFENFGIITMLNSYPNLSHRIMGTTNIFSVVKSMSTTVFFISLIITFLVLGITTIKDRRNGAQ